MGEAKRRKAQRQATHLPAPSIVAKADPFHADPGFQPTGSEKAHLGSIRRDCRTQSRKALKKAREVKDFDSRRNALSAVLLGNAYALEKQLEDFYQNSPDGPRIKRNIACSMGCYFCCHVMVKTTIVEAVAVAMGIQANDPAMIEWVKDTAPKVAGLSPEDRLVKKIPCPLLKNGLCGVHAYRPLKCRATLSYDYKPCEATLKAATVEEQSKILIPRFGLPTLIEPYVSEAIRLASDDEGLQSCTVEMTAALNLIFTDDTAIDRWLAGEKVFTPYA